jgi:hypothetical protein
LTTPQDVTDLPPRKGPIFRHFKGLKKEFSELLAVAVNAGVATIAGAAFFCARPITGKARIDVNNSKFLMLAFSGRY